MTRVRTPQNITGVRYDASFRKVSGDGSSHFVKIGVGFPGEKGRITVILDALPISDWDGKITLFPHSTPDWEATGGE